MFYVQNLAFTLYRGKVIDTIFVERARSLCARDFSFPRILEVQSLTDVRLPH